MKKTLLLLAITITIITGCEFFDETVAIEVTENSFPKISFKVVNFDIANAEGYTFMYRVISNDSYDNDFPNIGQVEGDLTDITVPVTITFSEPSSSISISVIVYDSEGSRVDSVFTSIDYPGATGAAVSNTIPDSDLHMDFICIEKGDYTVGSHFGDYSEADYKEASNCTLKNSFLIGTKEVSYEIWYQVLKWAQENSYTFLDISAKGYDGNKEVPTVEDVDYPVSAVKWLNAVLWCNAFSEMSGLEPLYYYDETYLSEEGILRSPMDIYNVTMKLNKTGYRLPYEEEWEIAARGGLKAVQAGTYGSNLTIVSYGNPDKEDYYWIESNSGWVKHKSGLKLPNELGLYDIIGNVSEICTDKMHTDYPYRDHVPYYNEWEETIEINGDFPCRGGSYLTLSMYSFEFRKVDPYLPTKKDTILNSQGFRVVKNCIY